MSSNDGANEMQQLIQLTEKSVRRNEAMSKSAKPAPPTNARQQYGITHALPRGRTIQTLEDYDRRMTKNMTKDTPLIPRVPPTAVLRVEKPSTMAQDDLPINNQMITRNKFRRRQHAQARPTFIDSAPARNTRSQTRTTDTASSRKIPSTRSSKRLSQSMQTTPDKRNKMAQAEHATSIEECINKKQLRQKTRKFNSLEI